ncbi:uncharacterized protein B0H18DRAFT_1116105 [Fomitopsis serialis]|uniref:uncharacterized protein n=1 Tax=Fomitopsis serialis TaxID=139415 RepID=UPI0020079EFC|nr:uncharacterized protein B0H18DRAFT_1116105 [Neoantrodia serialis]KAH9931851.1 hypothetical protein B0H18DRAFT_1116105 [Neoantrodia serialis]
MPNRSGTSTSANTTKDISTRTVHYPLPIQASTPVHSCDPLARHDARDVAQPSLRKAVKVVPQDSVVFSASIAYNVSKPGAVTKAARMPERITSFLDGYSRMGERGVGLSGREAACGDRRDAPSVPRLLDEPTSALEAATEKDI